MSLHVSFHREYHIAGGIEMKKNVHTQHHVSIKTMASAMISSYWIRGTLIVDQRLKTGSIPLGKYESVVLYRARSQASRKVKHGGLLSTVQIELTNVLQRH